MMKRILSYTFALAMLITLALPAVPAQAAAASIYLTAYDQRVAPGSNLILALYMNGGGKAVNAVEANLSYSASKLQYIGLSYTGSAFEIGASGSGGGGSINVSRGTTGSVPGSGLIATITFKALASSGSSTISVNSNSSLVANGNSVPHSNGSIGVTFGGSSGGSSGGTSSAKAEAPKPKDAKPPKISQIKTKNVTPFSVIITWKTDEVSDSAVDFGLDATYGLSSSAKKKSKDHEVKLSNTFLTPQMVLHYRVKSIDASGNAVTSPDQTLQLPGVTVTVIVRGANGKPQPGATVTLDNASATTDKNGNVTLPSSLGDKKITTTYGGVTIQKSIHVAKSDKPLPPIQLDLNKQPVNPWFLTTIALMIVVFILLTIDAALFGSKFFMRLTGLRKREKAQAQPMAAAPPEPEVEPTPESEPEPESPAVVEPEPEAEPQPEIRDPAPEFIGPREAPPERSVVDDLAVDEPEPLSELAPVEAPSAPPLEISSHKNPPINITLAPVAESTDTPAKQIAVNHKPAPTKTDDIAARLKKKPAKKPKSKKAKPKKVD